MKKADLKEIPNFEICTCQVLSIWFSVVLVKGQIFWEGNKRHKALTKYYVRKNFFVSKWEIFLSNFVTFSQYLNFNNLTQNFLADCLRRFLLRYDFSYATSGYQSQKNVDLESKFVFWKVSWKIKTREIASLCFHVIFFYEFVTLNLSPGFDFTFLARSDFVGRKPRPPPLE